jgi:hypothetical protein
MGSSNRRGLFLINRIVYQKKGLSIIFNEYIFEHPLGVTNEFFGC